MIARISGWTMLVVMLVAGPLMAQNQNQTNQFRGIVIGSPEDSKSFNLVNRSGQIESIQVTGNTVYETAQQQVNFAAAIVYGMEVQGTYAADGSAAQVSARGLATEVEDQQLKAFMGVSDAEWAVLEPKIQRIQTLKRMAEGSGGGRGNRGGTVQRNAVRELRQNLGRSFFNLSLQHNQLQNSLSNLRQEQARTRAELAQARHELQQLLTTRQEVLLVNMEILE